MENISKKSKILAAISYVPFPPLFLIPLFAAKNDAFDEFHGKQGLVFFVVWFVFWIVTPIPLIAVVAYLGLILLIVGAIVAAVQSLLGRRWVCPFLGKYALRLKL